jgi:four helix bundle protein
MAKLNSFRDLNVYQQLRSLHLEIHNESLKFPKFEMFELGSQMRRSSNSAPANLAEGWGSRHTNIYLEAVNRSLGEVRETQHHVDVACNKGYFTAERFQSLDGAYDGCGRMLERLYQSLSEWRDSRPTSTELREPAAAYGAAERNVEWEQVVALTERALSAPTT